MKNMKRFLSMLLILCMLVGTVGVLPISAAEYSSDYAISNVIYVPTGTLGSTQDILQWSNVGAPYYRVDIHDENNTVIDYAIQTENYVPAAQILPYSGKFYVVVTPVDENWVSIWSGTESEMFTYKDTVAPTVAFLPDYTVRSNDSEATVRFDHSDFLSACTYYYAVVESGAAAPTIDTSGTGIAANKGSNNYINLTGLTAGAKDIYLVLKDQDGNASAPIKTTIPAYVKACTCVDRCMTADLAASNCPVCIAADSPAECMGTPELMENGQPWRLSDTEAEVGFYGSVNPDVTWKYYYLLTDNSAAQPTASDILASGKSGIYEDPHTLVLSDLTAGGKYIHIVLRQEEQNRTTNVLRLVIPAFVKLTLTPSANGGDYDPATNTLTIKGGGTVNFALNAPGYVHCDSDDTIEATPVNGESENATEWTVTLPAAPDTYTFYYGLGGQEAWCTVVVVENTHQHSYASTWFKDASGHWHECECGEKSDFAGHTSSGAATEEKAEVCTLCGYEIAPKLEHVHTEVFLLRKLPTCTEPGLSEGVMCGSCGEILEPQEEIPAYGHTSSGPASATEDEVCSVCGEILTSATGYTLTLVYDVTLYNGIRVSEGAENRVITGIEPGTLIEFSPYWPKQMTIEAGGSTYWFGGFEDRGKLLDYIVMDEDVTLYAAWVRDPAYTVTLDPQGGNLDVKKVRDGMNLSEIYAHYVPTRQDHTFLGWSFQPEGPVENKDTRIPGDCTLYAQWEHNHVNFEYLMRQLPTCTRTGLTEGRKCVDCGKITEPQEEIPMLPHIEELLMKTLPTCTKPGLSDGKKCSVCGEILEPQEEIPAYGHTYAAEWSSDAKGHWHECECGDQKDFAGHTSSGAATVDAAEVCTVCGYEIAPPLGTHTLTLVMGNETIGGDLAGLETKKYHFAPGTVVDLSKHWPALTAAGSNGKSYYFAGFVENSNGSGVPMNTVTVNSDLTLYASWVTNPMITVTFDANGGTMPYAAARAKMHVVVDLMNWQHIPVRSGYDFAGWSLADDGTADNGEVEVETDCTLYAIWQETTPTGYTLTLHYGVMTEEINIAGGSKKVGNIAPGTVVDLSEHWPDSLRTVSDDTLSGFYYFAGFTKKGQIAIMDSVTVNSDMELQAEWVTQEMITVTFDANGGDLPGGTRKCRVARYESVDSLDQFYIPTRDGYTFLGWSLENDGTADDGEFALMEDCTLYAVWRQDSPFYDDDYYDPPPASIPIRVGGYDAILRDGVVIVRGDDPISGTLDLGKTDAEAIRLPADAVKASTGEGNSATIRYPDGTSAFITAPGWAAAGDALRSGESLQISVRPVDAGALPEELTTPPEDDGPYGGSEAAIDKSIFKATGIDNIEDRLKDLGLINGNTDPSVTEDEFEYLYHYLTTDELTALKNELNESAHFEHHQKAVAWLAEMIERDVVSPLTLDELVGAAGLSGEQLKGLSDVSLEYPGIGQIRQAGLTLEQMRLLQNNAEELREGASAEGQAQYDALLSWLEDAIAQKELEASYAQMDEWIGVLSALNFGGEFLEDVKKTAESMTTAELERFLENAHETNMRVSSSALGDLISFLDDELEARQAQEANTTYINVGGERAVFVGAIEADVKAVRASGTIRNIEILADRSNAVAWSTTVQVPTPLLDAPEWNVNKLRAYKVLEDGGLAAKAAKVTLNADGTLTLSALSDGNSTYIFVLEPNPYTDVDETDWYYAAAMTMDQRLVTLGASSATFGGGEPVSNQTVWTALARLDGVKTEDTSAQEWVVVNGISDGTNGDKNITREQLALMLWQYAKRIGMDVSVGESTNILSYTDFTEVSEDAIPAIQWAVGANILPDMGEELQPQREATRAEVAVALTRLIGEESPHTHAYEWVTDQEATTTAEGAKHEACVCGAVQGRGTVIPMVEAADVSAQPVDTEPAQAQPKESSSIGWIIAILAAIAAVVGGGAAWVIYRRKRRTN